MKGTGDNDIKVPGNGTLNKGDAQVSSVSCGSAGNCSAGGWYTDSTGYEQLMVVSEGNGTWQNAIEVPGSAPPTKGDYAPAPPPSSTSPPPPTPPPPSPPPP